MILCCDNFLQDHGEIVTKENYVKQGVWLTYCNIVTIYSINNDKLWFWEGREINTLEQTVSTHTYCHKNWVTCIGECAVFRVLTIKSEPLFCIYMAKLWGNRIFLDWKHFVNICWGVRCGDIILFTKSVNNVDYESHFAF